jgi:cell division protease FtsH
MTDQNGSSDIMSDDSQNSLTPPPEEARDEDIASASPQPNSPDEEKAKKNDKGGKGGKKKDEKSGPLFYILICLILALLVTQLLSRKRFYDLPYAQFVQLVELGAPEWEPDEGTELAPTEQDDEQGTEPDVQPPSAIEDEVPETLDDEESVPETEERFVEFETGQEKKRVTVRFSNLHDISIGPSWIEGNATYEVVAPEGKKKAPKEVQFRTSRYGLSFDNGYLIELTQEYGFKDVSGASPPSPLSDYGPIFFSTAVLLLFFFVIFRRVGGAALSLGRSRGKFMADPDVGVKFNDVAGVDEALEELQEVVEFLKRPEKYRVLGGRIPRGVLLVGPPGTGKTLLAKAVAGEAGVPFVSLSGSDFVELYVGIGAARVRDMFQQAQLHSPCIIFIDELDALGKTRSSNSGSTNDEREQTLNALLVEMDGFNTDGGTIVMAATNRPEILDPALLRSGRFDRQILVDRPDIRGREEILKVHAKKIKLDECIDLQKVAAMTPGFVGADLAALVNEAALLAARRSKDTVTMDEFGEGVERVTTGLEKRKRVMNENEKCRVAYHESGHALVAHLLPGADPVHKVSIIPRGLAALGYTMQRPEDDRYLMTQTELECQIQILLAGTISEELVFEVVSTGAQNDLERATLIARAMVMDYGMSRLGRVTFRENSRAAFLDSGVAFGQKLHSEQTAREIDEEIRYIIETLLENVRSLMKDRFNDLEQVTQHLLEKEVLDATELRELLGPSTSESLAEAAKVKAAED